MEKVVSAGLPVLYDKPASTRSDDLRRVAELARRKGLTAGAMLQWRYHPMTLSLKRALAKGALGDVLTIEGKMLNGLLQYRDTSTYTFDPEKAGHGILSWLGCHCLDLVLYLMEERVVEVMAMVGNLNPEKVAVEDTGFLILKFESGRMGTFQAGYHLRGGKATYDFYIGMRGTEGFAILPYLEPQEETSGGSEVEHTATYSLFSEARGWNTGGVRKERLRFPIRRSTAASWRKSFSVISLTLRRAGRRRRRQLRIRCICWRSLRRPRNLRSRAAPSAFPCDSRRAG